MSTKQWTLNTEAMQEEFFADTALIGIVSTLPGYQFCWMLNKQLETNFVREPEMDVCVQSGKDQQHYFPIYQYNVPMSGSRYVLYKLKSQKESLLPEVKQLDYLWMVQSNSPENDAQNITQHLRDIPEVQLAQVISADRLKNLNHLIV
jgi:hypothetical protein